MSAMRQRMMVRFGRAITLIIALAVLANLHAGAQGTTVKAQYTGTPVVLDGKLDAVWSQATPYPLAYKYNAASGNYTAPTAACNATSTMRALWDGAKLYVMISVSDPYVSGGSAYGGDAAEFWIDHFNDKVQKFEEDDGTFVISAPGTTGTVATSSNGTNAGDNIFPNLSDRYLAGYKSALQTDASGNTIGYNVEFAWYIGDHVSAIGNHASLNGSSIGFDATVYVADAVGSSTRTCRLMLSSATADRTTNNNQPWGTIVLSGYDPASSAPMQLDTFLLNVNIGAPYLSTLGTSPLPPVTNKGTWAAAAPNAWTDATALTSALTYAQAATTSTSQSAIDSATSGLDSALKGLKRNGPYPFGGGPLPDPYDLPQVNNLNDPFQFMDGSRVQSIADWNRRRQEIMTLAQYYEYGWYPPAPAELIATSSGTGTTKTIAMNIAANNGNTWSNATAAKLTIPTGTTVNGKTAPWPVIVSIDLAATPGTAPAAYLNAGYAVLDIGYTMWANDGPTPSGAVNTLYPYDVNSGHDYGSLMGWAWGTSRALDAVQYLLAHDSTYTGVDAHGNSVPLIDMNKASVIGFSRCGKATLAAGFFDQRFKVTAPGGSGNGGAAPYRYAADANSPFQPKNNFGHTYWWSGGAANGGESMGDHIRHNTWNTNQMSRSFLNDNEPQPKTYQPRMYRQYTWGYGTRLPFDHHMVIGAIAPRAVLLDESSDDYADEAEGDAVGYEGALPIFKFLGAQQNLAIDTYMETGNPAYHSLKTPQQNNFISFLDFVLYGIPLPAAVAPGDNTFVLPANAVPTNTKLYTDFYLTGAVDHSSIYDYYYGGLSTMMPWLTSVPHANLLSQLSVNGISLSPTFSMTTNDYAVTLPPGTSSIQIAAVSEDPKATVSINGKAAVAGSATLTLPEAPGNSTISIAVIAQDGATNTYLVNVAEAAPSLSLSLTPNTLGIAIGATGQVTLTMTPVGPYAGAVTLACGQLPANLTCSFSSSTVSFTGASTAQTSTITIGTTASASLAYPKTSGASASGIALGFIALPSIGFIALLRRSRSSGLRRLFVLAIITVASLGTIVAASGCGGSSSSSKKASAGSYVVPVTVTANGATTTVNMVVVVH